MQRIPKCIEPKALAAAATHAALHTETKFLNVCSRSDVPKTMRESVGTSRAQLLLRKHRCRSVKQPRELTQASSGFLIHEHSR